MLFVAARGLEPPRPGLDTRAAYNSGDFFNT